MNLPCPTPFKNKQKNPPSIETQVCGPASVRSTPKTAGEYLFCVFSPLPVDVVYARYFRTKTRTALNKLVHSSWSCWVWHWRLCTRWEGLIRCARLLLRPALPRAGEEQLRGCLFPTPPLASYLYSLQAFMRSTDTVSISAHCPLQGPRKFLSRHWKYISPLPPSHFFFSLSLNVRLASTHFPQDDWRKVIMYY